MEEHQIDFSFEDKQFLPPESFITKARIMELGAADAFEILLQESPGILSFDQLYIVYLRLIGLSYNDVQAVLKISSHDTIRNHILRTVEGRVIVAIKKPYLGEVDERIFAQEIRNHAHDLNCLTLAKARDLAVTLKRRRFKLATKIILGMSQNYRSLLDGLQMPGIPDKSWLEIVTKRNQLYISRPQKLELIRRLYYNSDVIISFFDLTITFYKEILISSSTWLKLHSEQIENLKFLGIMIAYR